MEMTRRNKETHLNSMRSYSEVKLDNLREIIKNIPSDSPRLAEVKTNRPLQN